MRGLLFLRTTAEANVTCNHSGGAGGMDMDALMKSMGGLGGSGEGADGDDSDDSDDDDLPDLDES